MTHKTKRIYSPDWTGAEKRWADFLDKVCESLAERCKGVETSPMYWPDPDDGEYYCEDCRPEKWDGGTNNDESDGQANCCKCGMILECCFTNWGVESEIGDSTADDVMNDPISPEEAYTLLEIIQCGVPRLTERCGDFVYNAGMKPNVRRIAKRLRIVR